ncbi:MAG: hypothetical protein ACRCTS_10300, partial [Fusobacteriaceae bacterium]
MAIRNADYLKMRLTTSRSKEDFTDLIDTIFALENAPPTDTGPQKRVMVSPQADIDNYISTDYFGVYVHGTKNGVNDLPEAGCYHGDAWVIDNYVYMWSATSESWVNLGVMVGVQGPEGPEGPEGVQGIEGQEGPEGMEGLPGVDGPQGVQGAKGEQGPAGLGLHIMGTIKSVDELYGKCISRIGQTWFLDGSAWMWDGEAFVELGKMQGPEGSIGPQGIQGQRGEKGDRGDTGKEGLAGAQGPRGPQGDLGNKGDKGDIGEAVDLIVRTVKTVSAKEPANVIIGEVIGEKDPKQYIDFEIPRGERGNIGPVGPPNYIEVDSVGVLPYGEMPQVAISSQSTYGIKIKSGDSEYVLSVDNFGVLWTDRLTEENNVPGFSYDHVKVYNEDYTKSIILYIDSETGKLARWMEESSQPEAIQRTMIIDSHLIRTSTVKDPILFLSPNMVTWRMGVGEYDQLYTAYYESDQNDSMKYVTQQMSILIPEGRKGDKGNIGRQGPVNKIMIGEIESLPAGESPEITIEDLYITEALPDELMNSFYLCDSKSTEIIYRVFLDSENNLSAEIASEEFPKIRNGIILGESKVKYSIKITDGILTSEIAEDQSLQPETLMVSANDTQFYIIYINLEHKLCTTIYELSSYGDTIVSVVGQKLNLKLPMGLTGNTGKRGLATEIMVEDTYTLPEGELAEVIIGAPVQINDFTQTQKATFKLPKGDRGHQGWSIDHKWEDTTLFIKREDSELWLDGVDLKGERGDSEIFVGGDIFGETLVHDCMVFKTTSAFKHELVYGLKSLIGKDAIGYNTVIAKNTLQIGYNYGDDNISLSNFPNLGDPFDTDKDKYMKTPSEIIMQTIGGASIISQEVNGELNITNQSNIFINTAALYYNGNKVFTEDQAELFKIYVDGKFEDVVNDATIRSYILEEDLKHLDLANQYSEGRIVSLETKMSEIISETDRNRKIYVDMKDSEHLKLSKEYTDLAILNADPSGPIISEINSLRKYVDSQDIHISNSAFEYTDGAILTAIVENMPSVKTYIDNNDTLTYELANQFTKDFVESALDGFEQSDVLTEYIDERDKFYNNISESYTNEIVNQMKQYLISEDNRNRNELSIMLANEVIT